MGKLVDVKMIVVDVRIGAALSEVIKECIVLAATEWRDVKFTHNDNEHIIRVDEFFKCCKST